MQFSIFDCPFDVWCMIFNMLTEADKRKMCVTCWFFFDLCESLVKKGLCHLLPFQVDDVESILDNKIVYKCPIFDFFVANEKFFKITGNSPKLLVNLNDTQTFEIPFDNNFSNTLFKKKSFPNNLDTVRPFSVKILKCYDCVLLYTHCHSRVYYVDGCTTEDIHSVMKFPCIKCFPFDTSRLKDILLRNDNLLFKMRKNAKKQDQYRFRPVRYCLMGKRNLNFVNPQMNKQ